MQSCFHGFKRSAIEVCEAPFKSEAGVASMDTQRSATEVSEASVNSDAHAASINICEATKKGRSSKERRAAKKVAKGTAKKEEQPNRGQVRHGDKGKGKGKAKGKKEKKSSSAKAVKAQTPKPPTPLTPATRVCVVTPKFGFWHTPKPPEPPTRVSEDHR